MTTKSTTKTKTVKKSTAPSSRPQTKASAKATTNTKAKTTTAKSHTTTKPTQKPGEKGRFIACAIGAIAMVALIVVGISFLADSITNHGKSSFVVTTGSGEKLETQYVGFDDYTFQIKIPKSFHALNSSEIETIYGDTNTPGFVYANEDNSASVAINLTSSKLTNDQVKTYLDTTADLLGMSSEIIDRDTTSVANHTVASIRLTTASEYNYMRFFSQRDQLVIISFRCDANKRDNWEPVGKYILGSLDFTR